MPNAWHNIMSTDYDAHMSHPNVGQAQMLSKIMKEQFELIPLVKQSNSCVAILGITNGNGLEHVKSCRIKRVIGIDINQSFLDECRVRHSESCQILDLFCLDLMTETTDASSILSPCDLIIANLLIEHIHLENFAKIVNRIPKQGKIISCVIQVNPDGSIASSSGVEHVFNDVVKQIEEENENALNTTMHDCGFSLTHKATYDLPNGKQLKRLDYTAY